MERIIDIHMHVIPGIDDGSGSMEESLEEIRMSAAQGTGTIFATPHSWAIEKNSPHMYKRFLMLKEAVRKKQLPVQLFPGCEVLCYPFDMNNTIRRIQDGTYPTMGNTRFVLAEFDPYDCDAGGMAWCVDRFVEANYIPIIAHAERYGFMTVADARIMKSHGAYIQINAYSVVNEAKEHTRSLANKLLEERLVDFVGTDAHRLSHRPPILEEGIKAIADLFTPEYAEKILIRNPEELLIKGNHITY